MGRPIKKKFFGNLNNQQYGNVGTGSGIGGEGVSSSITVTNTGTAYSQGSVVTFSAPGLPTGVTATGTPVFTANGTGAFGITGINLTGAGRGYTGTATITVTTASGVNSVANSGLAGANTFTVTTATGIAVGMLISGGATGVSGRVTGVSGNIVSTNVANNGTWTNATNLWFWDFGSGAQFITSLTAVTQNAISVNAYLPVSAGGSGIKASDIVKQEASLRYLVKNADGIGQCKLVASNSPAAGEMNITATDTLGSTYWVTKLTARRCRLVQRSNGGSGYAFADNSTAGWTLGSASTGVVSIGSA